MPDITKRDFSRIAALLETADFEFTRLKKSLLHYEENIETEIKANPQEVEINRVSLNSYGLKSKLLKTKQIFALK